MIPLRIRCAHCRRRGDGAAIDAGISAESQQVDVRQAHRSRATEEGCASVGTSTYTRCPATHSGYGSGGGRNAARGC